MFYRLINKEFEPPVSGFNMQSITVVWKVNSFKSIWQLNGVRHPGKNSVMDQILKHIFA